MHVDSVLIVSFGGPQGLADIRPFLANVLRGRWRVAPSASTKWPDTTRYSAGSHRSPTTLRQARVCSDRLAAPGYPLPVYVGMRNWHPLLEDTLRRMHDDGVKNAVGFIAAAQHSYSSCQQYRENVGSARAALRAATGGDVGVTYVSSWFDHPGFIAANARHVRDAVAKLPEPQRTSARLVFTAHSVPVRMAEASRYREQLLESARLVAAAAGMADWALVYQSRSGRPEDPWLEPDVGDYLRREHAAGLSAAVLCPIGFVCDHIEVLYDLDREAARVCAEIGMPMTRAATVNDDPVFLDMMADVVLATIQRHEWKTAAVLLMTVRLKPDTTAIDIAVLPPPTVSERAVAVSKGVTAR